MFIQEQTTWGKLYTTSFLFVFVKFIAIVPETLLLQQKKNVFVRKENSDVLIEK